METNSANAHAVAASLSSKPPVCLPDRAADRFAMHHERCEHYVFQTDVPVRQKPIHFAVGKVIIEGHLAGTVSLGAETSNRHGKRRINRTRQPAGIEKEHVIFRTGPIQERNISGCGSNGFLADVEYCSRGLSKFALFPTAPGMPPATRLSRRWIAANSPGWPLGLPVLS